MVQKRKKSIVDEDWCMDRVSPSAIRNERKEMLTRGHLQTERRGGGEEREKRELWRKDATPNYPSTLLQVQPTGQPANS